MTETLRNSNDDIEVLDQVREWVDVYQQTHPHAPFTALLRLVEDHIDACHELLSYARNHANYTESQQWRDWAHRLDIILPEIRRHS